MSNLFIPNKMQVSQNIRTIVLGNENINQLTIGNNNEMTFINNNNITKPKLAVEIFDQIPDNYPEYIKTTQEKYIHDPIKHALKAKELGADIIVLKQNYINTLEKSHKNIICIAKEIINTTKLPIIILGVNNRELDKYHLPKIAEGLAGLNCLIGQVEEETYNHIIPSCRDNGHCVIARTPIDINLAKQLNILICKLGFDPNKIVIDPNMGALGYGIDYTYSIIEKIRLAAFEGDNMLNMPIIAISGEESWRTKEAKADINNDFWGKHSDRALMWELLTTSSIIMAGADIVVMRYLPSIKYLSEFIKG